VKRLIPCLVLAASGLANQSSIATKPACNSSLRGHFWPAAADSDPKLARRLSQCGSLEVCSVGRFRYKWQPVTVNVRQLGKSRQDPTPECAALIAQF